jgi:hypothetical protein
MDEGVQASIKFITTLNSLCMYEEKVVSVGFSLLFLIKKSFSWRICYIR